VSPARWRAALLAVAFLHVRDSHFGVTDVPMTFMILLAFAAIVSLDRLPQLVIVQSSRLAAYSHHALGPRESLADRYRLLARIDVEKADSAVEPIFDQEDAFFAPVAGFERFVRPGPSIEIYERIDRSEAAVRRF
jgi:hypothetical protein